MSSSLSPEASRISLVDDEASSPLPQYNEQLLPSFSPASGSFSLNPSPVQRIPSSRLVDPHHKLVCINCTELLHNPVQLGCGCFTCLGCWQKWCDMCILKRFTETKCYSCHEPIPIDQPNNPFRSSHVNQLPSNLKMIAREMAAVEVKCEWCDIEPYTLGVDNRNEIAHRAVCNKKPTPCTNPGCTSILTPLTIHRHMVCCPKRLKPCDLCGDQVANEEYVAHTTSAFGCVNMVECPNGCLDPKRQRTEESMTPPTLRLSKKEMAVHLESCEERLVSCRFKCCNEKIKQAELYNHTKNKIGKHFVMLDERNDELQKKYDELKLLVESVVRPPLALNWIRRDTCKFNFSVDELSEPTFRTDTMNMSDHELPNVPSMEVTLFRGSSRNIHAGVGGFIGGHLNCEVKIGPTRVPTLYRIHIRLARIKTTRILNPVVGSDRIRELNAIEQRDFDFSVPFSTLGEHFTPLPITTSQYPQKIQLCRMEALKPCLQNTLLSPEDGNPEPDSYIWRTGRMCIEVEIQHPREE